MVRFYDKRKKGMKKAKSGKFYYPKKGGKPAAKKAVKRVQQKTELKDRVVSPASHDLTSFSGSQTNGPGGSYIMVPESLLNKMAQGDLNGQLHGNEYCPKYLNMKLKLNFEHLDPFGGEHGTDPQSYYITLTQGWIKINLKDSGALTQVHNNTASGRMQPAFIAGADPHSLATTIAKRALFNANFEREFLSYEKRAYDDVKVIKRFRVYGDMRKRFVTPQGGGGSTEHAIAPDKHYSLNWRMTNKKQELAPITGETQNYGNALTWIPFCMITLHADIALTASSKLVIQQANHFTYSDL
jgi:hypothetical protein